MNKVLAFVALIICIQPLAIMAEQLCQSDTIKATTPLERFIVEKSVVTDKGTGLMWRRCFMGARGPACEVGEPIPMTWPTAFQAIDKLNKSGGFAGFSDWRMPNIRELQTIVELQCVKPAINLALFPSAPDQRVWSASPYQFYPHYSWYVDFKYFKVTYQERYKPQIILLVRSPAS